MTLSTKARLRRWDPAFLNGRAGNINRATRLFIMRAYRAGLRVTSTTGGKHAPGSYHYTGQAADVAGPLDAMVRFQRREHTRRGRRYRELFGPSNGANRVHGRAVRLPEGSGLEVLHRTHVHGSARW